MSPFPSYSFWIPFIIFDGTLVILTLYKAFSYRTLSSHTIRLLARDSVIYFAIMLMVLLENVLTNVLTTNLPITIPADWIACIAVSRMMMNIRGLVFDDPRGTDGLSLKLTALKFHTLSPDRTLVRPEQIENSPEAYRLGNELHDKDRDVSYCA
jgi:hypothetical protein